jgi:hypothetical protein
VWLVCSVADAFTGMGVVLKDLKRLPEAEACFEAVVRLRPNCALAHGNLAGMSVVQRFLLLHPVCNASSCYTLHVMVVSTSTTAHLLVLTLWH